MTNVVDHAIVIRGTGLSVESVTSYGLISLLAIVALWVSFRNLARTKLQQMYMMESAKLKSVPTKKGQADMDYVQSSLRSSAMFYSMSLISMLFLTAFVLLAAGLLASLPTFFNFGVSVVVPSVALAVLTSPRV